MKFSKSGNQYRAISGGDTVTITQSQDGWWIVSCNGKRIEDFQPDQLKQAKKWAAARYAA